MVDEECPFFLDQRNQAKMQWVHDPNHSKVDKLHYSRHAASRHFRNKKKEHMEATIDEHGTNSKITNIRDCTGTSLTLRRVTSLEYSKG